MSLASRQTQTLRLILSSRQLQALGLLQMTNEALAEDLLRRAEANPLIRLRLPKYRAALPPQDDLPEAAPGLHDHVQRQLRLAIADPATLDFALAFVEALDPNGWLDRPLEEIAGSAGRTTREAQDMLARLQAEVEPAGLFARDLRECLGLQAAERGQLSPAMAAVLDRLPLLAAGGVRAVAVAAGLPSEQVQACLDRIRRMNPKPGAGFGDGAPVLREPDLVVARGPEGWRVELNRGTLPAVTLPPHIAGPGASLRAARSEAEWLANVLERRNRTVLAVASAVMERQTAFLDEGPGSLVALTQAQIADALGLHDSTVSRVARNLLVATPHGLRSLCSFFDTAPVVARVGEVAPSSTAIRHRLRQMIAAEDPMAPLSDAALAEALRREGKPLARRTVAKFRDELGIPPMSLRRQGAKIRSAL